MSLKNWQDSVKYNFGTDTYPNLINLNDRVTTFCNTTSLYDFKFVTNNQYTVNREIELSLYIVYRGMQNNYNEFVQKLLMLAASNELKQLRVNDWTLDCRIVGLTEFKSYNSNVRSFNVILWAPKLLWCKLQNMVTINKGVTKHLYLSYNFGISFFLLSNENDVEIQVTDGTVQSKNLKLYIPTTDVGRYIETNFMNKSIRLGNIETPSIIKNDSAPWFFENRLGSGSIELISGADSVTYQINNLSFIPQRI